MTEEEFQAAKAILTGKTIVIADDNGGILTWLKLSLQDYGAIVNTFKHGQEAIDFISETRRQVDVLVLDLIMNHIGGIEIAKANRRLPHPAFILFLTGCSPDKPQYNAAEELGLVVQKPVGVFRVIQEILAGLCPPKV